MGFPCDLPIPWGGGGGGVLLGAAAARPPPPPFPFLVPKAYRNRGFRVVRRAGWIRMPRRWSEAPILHDRVFCIAPDPGGVPLGLFPELFPWVAFWWWWGGLSWRLGGRVERDVVGRLRG